MTLNSLLLLVALSVSQVEMRTEADDSAQVTRAFSLRGLEPIPLDEDSLHFPMSPLHADQDTSIWYDAEREEPEYDALVQFLVSSFYEEYENAEASIEIDQDHLLLRGSPKLVEGTERLIRYWRDTVLRPASVRILRGNGGEMSEAVRMQLSGNAQSEVRRTHLLSVVAGFELNVASRAATFSPRTRQVLIGDVQLATADPFLEGMQVSWLTRTPELLRVRERDARIQMQLSTEDSNSVRVSTSSLPDPLLMVRSVATSAGLTSIRGLEIETAAKLPGGISWIEVNRMELNGAPPQAIHRLDEVTDSPGALIAQGLMAPNHWKISGMLTSLRGGWPDTGEPPYWLTLGRGTFDIWNRLARYMPENSDLRTDSLGPFAQVLPEELAEAPKETLDQTLTNWSRDSSLPRQLEITLQLTRSGSDSAELRLRAPISSGAALVATVGSERLAVVRQESYIAEGSSICAPELAPTFQGMVVHLEPALFPDGTLFLSLSVESRIRRGEMRADVHTGIEHEDFDVLSVRDLNLRLTQGEDGAWTHRFGSRSGDALSLSFTAKEL